MYAQQDIAVEHGRAVLQYSLAALHKAQLVWLLCWAPGANSPGCPMHQLWQLYRPGPTQRMHHLQPAGSKEQANGAIARGDAMP